MSSIDYVICARDVKNKAFVAEPGESRFLFVPTPDLPKPSQAVKKKVFLDAVMQREGEEVKTHDILVFIHGYNNEQEIVMQRHRLLASSLRAEGYAGQVVSFDWPSDDKALNYLEDRCDAKATALQLVTDCIALFAELQKKGCFVNVHLLAHSTGAYVIREAFDDADDRPGIAVANWNVSQVALIGGDVSSSCMSLGNAKTSSLYRHMVRLTNYSNLNDSVLKLSNMKRAGVAPRVGRIGLPGEHPPHAVNVDCTQYYEEQVAPDGYSLPFYGTKCHSWHIGNPVFTKDLAQTLAGDRDRSQITTRAIGETGLRLV